MTGLEVKSHIEREIGGDFGYSNAHGIDLNTCLVNPERRRFLDSFNENQTLDLWLILEEDVQTHEGYKIVFDENNGRYGLAIANSDGCDIFLGFYGTFIETLDAM